MLPLITLIALSVAQLTGAGKVRDNALDAQDALLHIKSVENFVAQIQEYILYYAVLVENYYDKKNQVAFSCKPASDYSV